MLLCCETEAMFESGVMQHFIRQQQAKESKQWVFQVLDGTRESEDVIYRDTDTGYVLLPCPADVQGRRKGYIAIVADRSLRCIRDLRGEHANLLEEIRDTCLQHLPADITHTSIHYHPSVYQLHIHFRNGRGVKAEDPRIFPLADIVRNLRKNSLHYKHADLVYSLPPASEIGRLFRQQHAAIRSDHSKGSLWSMTRKKGASHCMKSNRVGKCHYPINVGACVPG